MKNIKLFSLLAVVGLGSIFVTSCGPVEEVDPSPVLEFIGDGEYVSSDISLSAQQEFKVGISASHVSKMVGLNITVSYDGGDELVPANCSLCDSTIDTKDLRVDFTGTTGVNAGSEKWSFTITDKDGNATTKSITITNLGDPGASLIEFTDDAGTPFRVYNFQGTKLGAYQIGAGPLSSGDPNSFKDIQDSTSNNDLPNWPARWTSRNGSTFKSTTTHTWANMSNETALNAAWDELGAAESVINPAKGETYLINIKNSGKIALIEITDVVETPSDNNDYIQFIYKYAP